MSYRPSVIAALLALLATPASAGNVIDPYTLFPAAAGYGTPILGTLFDEINIASGVATVDLPDAIPSNTLVVVAFATYSPLPTTVETGWTSTHAECRDTSANRAVKIFHKLVTDPGGEPTELDFTVSTANTGTKAIAIAFPGVTAVDAFQCETTSGAGITSHTAPNVTPTEPTGLSINIFSALSASLTSPPATSLVSSSSLAGLNRALAVSYNPTVGTSPQGGVTFTTTSSLASARMSMAVH